MQLTSFPAALLLAAALAGACDQPAALVATPTDGAAGQGGATTPRDTVTGTRWLQLATYVGRTCGVRDSGRVFCTADTNSTPAPRALPARPGGAAAAISYASSGTPCTLGDEGVIQCWVGDRWSAPFTEDHRFAQIDGGPDTGCALTAAGAPWCWWFEGTSRNPIFRFVAIGGAPPLTQIQYGYYFACGLARDGAAYCWTLGPVRGTAGQLGDGTLDARTTAAPVKTDVRFASLALGSLHACGRTAAGEVWCWGSNMGNALGVPRDVAREGCGTGELAAAAPFSWATHWCTTPQRVETTLRFRALSAASERTCGLTDDGTAYCWGANQGLTLGVATVADGACRLLGPTSGPTPCTARPTAVSGGLRFAVLARDRGGYHQCAVTESGRAYCWGAVRPDGRPALLVRLDDGSVVNATAQPVALADPTGG